MITTEQLDHIKTLLADHETAIIDGDSLHILGSSKVCKDRYCNWEYCTIWQKNGRWVARNAKKVDHGSRPLRMYAEIVDYLNKEGE